MSRPWADESSEYSSRGDHQRRYIDASYSYSSENDLSRGNSFSSRGRTMASRDGVYTSEITYYEGAEDSTLNSSLASRYDYSEDEGGDQHLMSEDEDELGESPTDAEQVELVSKEDNSMMSKTTQGGKATLVVFLLIKLLANPFTNVVRQKSQTSALDFGIFLSQVYTIISTVLFTIAAMWQIKKGVVTKDQWQVPKWTFFVLGFMDSATRVIDFVSQPMFGAKGGAMVLLLNQTLIPITMFLAFILTGKRYSIPNFLGAGIIISGVALFVLPKQLRGEGGGTFSVVGLILRLTKNISFALMQIFQGRLMQKHKLDTLYLGWWVKVFGLPLGVLMSFGYFAILSGADSFGHQMREGFHCLGGGGVGIVDTCKSGLLLWTMLFNVGAFIDVYSALGILKHGNPTMLVVIMTLCLPITSLCFSSKPIMGDSATPLNAGDIYGLVVVVVGVLIYGLLGPAKDSIAFAAFISFASLCVFASFFVHGDTFSFEFHVGPEFGDLALFYGFLAILLVGLYLNSASPSSSLFLLRRRLGKWVGWPILSFPTVGELMLVGLYLSLMIGWGVYWFEYDRGNIGNAHYTSYQVPGNLTNNNGYNQSETPYTYPYRVAAPPMPGQLGPLTMESANYHHVRSLQFDADYPSNSEHGTNNYGYDLGPPMTQLESGARAMGHINEVNFALQLLPITRNSVWATVFGIPFDRLVRYHRWTGTVLTATTLTHAFMWCAVLAQNGMRGMCAVKSSVPLVRGVPDCSQVDCVPCSKKNGQWVPDSSSYTPRHGTRNYGNDSPYRTMQYSVNYTSPSSRYIYADDITAPVTYWENVASYDGFFQIHRKNWTIPFAQTASVLLCIYFILYKVSRMKAMQPDRNVVRPTSGLMFKLRTNFFEIFYYFHWSAMITFVFALLHNIKSSSNTMIRYIMLAVPLYLVDVCVRTWRSRKPAECVGLKLYEDNTILRIEMRRDGFQFESGQYLFLKAHALSAMQWHPFSISCGPDRENGFTVHVRDNGPGSWTNALIEEAMKHMDAPQNMIVTVDGAYGKTSLSYRGYSDVVLVAGGIGVTSVISVFEDTYRQISALTTEEKDRLAQRVWFMWVVSSESTIELFSDLLAEIDQGIEEHQLPMKMMIYVTGSVRRRGQTSMISGEDPGIELQAISLEDNTTADWSPDVIQTGRPNWNDFFNRVSKAPTNAKSKRAGVFVCGPTSLSREVAKVCVEMSADKDVEGRYDFHKERYRF